jgi:hypothetical protein
VPVPVVELGSDAEAEAALLRGVLAAVARQGSAASSGELTATTDAQTNPAIWKSPARK